MKKGNVDMKPENTSELTKNLDSNQKTKMEHSSVYKNIQDIFQCE